MVTERYFGVSKNQSRANIETATSGASVISYLCLEHLEIPEYPPLARQARIQVIQTVKVPLSGQATIQSVEQSLQGKVIKVEGLFKLGTEKAVKNSRFSKTCGGRTITLVFHYELRDDPNTSSLFAFGPPNHFWIRSGPVYAQP